MTDEIPASSRTDVRQAIALTIATWALSAVLYLIPFHVFSGVTLYVFLTVLIICTIGAILSAGVYVVVRRTRSRHPAVRLAALGGAVFAMSGMLALVDASTSEWIARLAVSPQKPAPFGLRATNNFAALVWQFALLGAAFTVIEANNLARDRERELARAREMASKADAAASAARLAALRYQLNPHFLFNTLNAISSLIVTRDYEPADAMLGKLSEFLRATLAAAPEALIALEDELATLQHYLEIESARFGERLEVAFVCPSELNDALVPSFVLQPLVENAIKYGVAPSAEPVAVRVEATTDGDMLVIFVEDDAVPGDAPAKPGTGLGIANIRQRLETLYGSGGTLETARRDRGFVSILRIPLARRRASLPEGAA
ncbi:sensor histidine kinase [Allosphingosinicella deserti]|uniref:Signal transduction histidine kinase LytS n=1 Tax=Allosphingosinicella deserti TaxID=2116704 RepID=A0A2P7QYT0_9SPHN|nr:histidine kinase [Sphingomonas deserti]PSJ43103.1 signal transduction histidine kinase LytS [Sphingomonas deserti]